jgi:hypothetical protein
MLSDSLADLEPARFATMDGAAATYPLGGGAC